MDWIDRLVTLISRAVALIGGLAVALMMMHVTLDVLFRYVLNRPLLGTLTMVTYYYMIIATFVPLAFVQRRDAHISVEVFTALMPPVISRLLSVLTGLLTMAVMGLLAWRGGDAAVQAMRKGAAQVQGDTEILVWPAYFAIPLGAGLMTLVLFWQMIRALAGRGEAR
jgi:TRAP-type C4-dicarboxylate transport system permease small subunit